MTEEQIDVADSPEVRIARLDEALKNFQNRVEAMSEAYAPTNRQVIENALKLSELEKDVTALQLEIPRQVERRETDFRQLESRVLSVAHDLGALERRWEKQRIAQENRERREKEQADREAEELRRQRAKERRDRFWLIVGFLVSLFIAILSVYLGTVLG